MCSHGEESEVAAQDAPAEPLAALSLDRLEREIGELAAHINAATCRWLLLVAEFERRMGHERQGFHCCARWLAWRCSQDARTAREHVHVARRLSELPLTRGVFARGELSFSKVRALCRVADQDSEADLLELSTHATAAQLERICRAYRRCCDVEGARKSQRDRYLTWHWDEDGSLVIRGRLPAEDGAVLVRALEIARDDLVWEERAAGGSAAPPPIAELEVEDERGATSADALLAMAESSHARTADERSGAERYQVVVHVDADALVADRGPSRCEIDDGPAIAAETARRLACDAGLVAMAHGARGTMSVGRRTRSVPAGIRRALSARDGGCRFPGCANRRFLDAHHIHHWARGGETRLDNLVQLCRRHHRLVHEHGFRIEGEPGGRLTFYRPDGRPIPAVAPSARGAVNEIVIRHRRGLSMNSTTCFPRSAGARMDLDLTVDCLMQRRERSRAP